jgi:hypothetical protein
MPFSQREKGISSLPSPLGRGAGVRDGGERGGGSGDLLDWRQEILQDAAGAEVDLGVHLNVREGTDLQRNAGFVPSCPVRAARET